MNKEHASTTPQIILLILPNLTNCISCLPRGVVAYIKQHFI